MNNDVEEVKSRLNLVDVVGDYVRLERAGAGQWKGLCPFHKERTPSFTVSEERQLWHCFGCGKGGDVFSFVMEQEGMTFRDALVALAERAGVELTRQHTDANANTSIDQKKLLYDILELATKFYQKQLVDGIGRHKARPYLTDRGISEMSIAEFRLGFAPHGWHHIRDFLHGRKYTLADIAAAGLIIQKDGTHGDSINDYYDRFRGRIMFPITDPLGRVVGFSARILPDDENDKDGRKQAKYINTTESPVYHKSAILYGIAHAKQAMKDTGRTVVVEGNLDVIAMHQAGIRETVAVSGTALTENHARIIRRYAPQVILFFDNDDAGRKAAFKSTALCVSVGLRVRVVMTDGEMAKDAADIALNNPAHLTELIKHSRDAVAFFLDRALATHNVATPDGRHAVIRTIAPLINAHASHVDKEYWVEQLAQRTQTSPATVTEELERLQAERDYGGDIQREATIQQESGTNQNVEVAQSDILLDNLLSLAAQSDDALRVLASYSFPLPLLEQKKALHALIMAYMDGATSFAQVLSVVDDESTRHVLEKVLRSHRAATTGIIITSDAEALAKEVEDMCARMIALWTKEERARLIATLSEAESSGNAARQKKIIKRIQELL